MQKTIAAFSLSVALLVGVSTVRAQYSTTFDTGYTADYLTSGQVIASGQAVSSGTGQNGWLTSDPENDNVGTATEFVGGSNYVGPANVGTPAFAGFSGNAASLGGNIRTQPNNVIVVPGAATSTLYHPFTVAPPTGQGYQFQTNFVVSVAQGATALTDTFAFTLGNGTTPLLTINFSTSTTSGRADIGYAVGAAASTRTGNGVTLNGAYSLTIQVNPVANTYTASYTGSGVTLGISSGSLATAGILPNAVTQAAAVWTLKTATKDANGGYSTASTDALLFDNYAVTYYTLPVTVPEPSTYMALGVGLLVLVGTKKFRRVV